MIYVRANWITPIAAFGHVLHLCTSNTVQFWLASQLYGYQLLYTPNIQMLNASRFGEAENMHSKTSRILLCRDSALWKQLNKITRKHMQWVAGRKNQNQSSSTQYEQYKTNSDKATGQNKQHNVGQAAQFDSTIGAKHAAQFEPQKSRGTLQSAQTNENSYSSTIQVTQPHQQHKTSNNPKLILVTPPDPYSLVSISIALALSLSTCERTLASPLVAMST